MKMTTDEFCTKHNACTDGREWALSVSNNMAVVWDAMIEQRKIEWLCWTAGRDGVLTEKQLRLLACQFVRETPLADGRKVWDLLTDERSRNAVIIAERFANGEATSDELAATWAAAWNATRAAARNAARAAARAAARNATWAAARAAAWAAARAAARAAAWDAARDAARAAAWDAARDAAWAAAWDAARAAARDAARAAAWDAAWNAAWDAAWAAARDAAGDAQCEMFRQFDNPFAKEPQ